MVSSFFSWGGFFMVIPLMAVHYVDHLGWAAGTIGIILALRHKQDRLYRALKGAGLLDWSLYLNLRDIVFMIARKR